MIIDVWISSAVIITGGILSPVLFLSKSFFGGARLLASMFIYIFHPLYLQLLSQEPGDCRILVKSAVLLSQLLHNTQNMHTVMFWFILLWICYRSRWTDMVYLPKFFKGNPIFTPVLVK